MKRNSDGSYRDRFSSEERASEYETSVYGSRTYGDVVWRIEQAKLRALLDEFRSTHRTVDYLDFAAGTGRIISFMEDFVDTATGIEISEAMAERAGRKVRNARIICSDITNPDARKEGQYDLITAFRFVLNAEPSLRLTALEALAARLRDGTSWLVFNNHGYLWSYRFLAFPYYAVKSLRKSGSKPRYLAHREVFSLAEQAGLRIDRVIGSGLLSGKVAGLVSFDKAVRWEELAAQNPVLSRFGMNQIYVARLK